LKHSSFSIGYFFVLEILPWTTWAA